MDIWDSEGQGNLKVKETADSLVDFVLHCITRVFMTVLLTKYECGDQVKNNETGVEWSLSGAEDKCIRCFDGETLG